MRANSRDAAVVDADAIVDKAGLETDIEKRDALYEQAGQMYFDAGFFIPLVDVDDVVVHAKGLTDLGLRPWRIAVDHYRLWPGVLALAARLGKRHRRSHLPPWIRRERPRDREGRRFAARGPPHSSVQVEHRRHSVSTSLL